MTLDNEDLEGLTYEQLCELGTKAQAVAERCLNEIERRGLLTFTEEVLPLCRLMLQFPRF